tara:strand:- start:99 stop:1103 length:1005 start_codon:yes stop_codon:yes gene_type:complete
MICRALLFLLIIFFFSCQEKKSRNTRPSFYYWKQEFKLDKKQKLFLKELNSKELYIKFFDIKMINGHPEPVAKIKFKTEHKDYIIIPCIYITNKVFKSKNVNPETLAIKTLDLINLITKKNKLNFKEVQIDCDWSSKSKVNYFRFLKTIKDKLSNNKLLSATIRLHQYKYWKKTGVPPINKGVLMCYNIGEIEKVNETNSIISYDLVKQYLKKGMSYPLKLSIALPIYKWALVFRLGQLSSIINDTDEKNMKGQIKKLNKNRYLVEKNFYKKGHFLSKNDELRFEKIDINELEKISKYISNLEFDKLVFYHLSQTKINDYETNKLDQINSNIIR